MVTELEKTLVDVFVNYKQSESSSWTKECDIVQQFVEKVQHDNF